MGPEGELLEGEKGKPGNKSISASNPKLKNGEQWIQNLPVFPLIPKSKHDEVGGGGLAKEKF